jgi:DNA repair protein RadD
MIKLREYQNKLISDAKIAIANGCKRLLIQSACGSGKTNLAAHITKLATEKNKSIIFCCHRNELLNQASATMSRFDIDHGFIAARYPEKKSSKVQLAMIDTLSRRFLKTTFPDILFVDEAHHAISPTWRKVIDFYTNNGSILIGLSATPERLDGKSLGDIFTKMIIGPSISSLIADGYLSSYKYYAPPSVVDMDGVKKKFGDYDIREQAFRIDRPHVFGDAIQHYKKILYGKKAIVFQVNISSSKNFAKQCNEHGVACLHVDGDMSPSERQRAIQSFVSGPTLILSNVGLFGEGFDVPGCDAVILLRKTASLSLFLQMCGRAMRPHPGKEYCTILDHMGNVSIHGLPDETREWSLSCHRVTKNKKLENVEDISIKQCKNCYHVFKPQSHCPNCGHEIISKKQETHKIDGELLEVTDKQIQLYKRIEVGKAKTLAELEKIALDRGYKKGWAKKMMEVRSRKYGRSVEKMY